MQQKDIEINQEYVKNLFDYKEDDITGYLIWKVDSGPNKLKGKITGSFSKSTRYYQVTIDNKHYQLHRIIFLWHHGYLPEYIDHIDRNRINNKINNLRETTSQNNNRNRKQQKSSSGIKGIFWDKRRSKWRAQIRLNNKLYHLGRYNNLDDAVLARYEKEQEVNWDESEESPAFKYLKEKNLI